MSPWAHCSVCVSLSPLACKCLIRLLALPWKLTSCSGYRIFQNKYKAEILKQLEHQSLIEAERKRVARMRQQQLESEQFLFFEDQLKKQELARGQTRSQETPARAEQTDGSALSCLSAHRNHALLDVFADQPRKSEAAPDASHSPPVNRALKPAAALSAVQSK